MTKIQLPQLEIKKFLDLASYVKCNATLMPITEYIKLDIKRGLVTMIFSNETNIVMYSFAVESSIPNCSILISYLELVKYYKEKRGAILFIKDYGKDDEKNSGKQEFDDLDFKRSYKIPFDIVIETFPKIPTIPKSDQFSKIEKKVINMMDSGRRFVLDESKDKLRPIFNNINIKDGLLVSTDRNISLIYSNIGVDKFFSFTLNVSSFVSNFDYFDCYISLENNWMIIKNKTVIFCERLKELDDNNDWFFNTINSFTGIIDKKNKIRISVKGFYDFCKSSIPYIKEETVNSKLLILDNGKVELTYSCEGNESGKMIEDEVRKIVDAEVIGYEKGFSFLFSQKQIMKVLEGLNKEILNISECVESNGRKGYIAFWLEGDDTFHSICSKGIEPSKLG